VPSFRPGPDPDFPYLEEDKYFTFPKPEDWVDSVVAIGGNLSPGVLLSAYEQGIFPWYNPGDPVIWQSPDPRMVIFPGKLRVSSSMRKILDQGRFKITFNEFFYGVIKGCSQAVRRKQKGGTWITQDIIAAYCELHSLGWALSAEAWLNGELVGGCYGLLIGKAFFGESMFARESNASKAAFLTLAKELFDDGLAFIDCQTPSDHLKSLGGEEIARADFLQLLKDHKVLRYGSGQFDGVSSP